MAGKPQATARRYAMVGSIRAGSTFIRCSTGFAFHISSALPMPMPAPIHRAWRTSGPISAWCPAPKRWATLGVVARVMPLTSRYTGTQIELPSATAARSCGLTRPAITVSTKPMAVLAS